MPAYKTIVIDPPWMIVYDTGAYTNMDEFKHGIKERLPYDTMKDADIHNFDIEEYADDVCYLFMWATFGKLAGSPYLVFELAIQLCRKWGFVVREIILWDKHNGIVSPFTPFRRQVEPIIFATRGITQIKPYGKYSSIFRAPSTTHSTKPVYFYNWLNKWTPKPRIDIFARNAHEGFDGWGDEYVGDGPLKEFLT